MTKRKGGNGDGEIPKQVDRSRKPGQEWRKQLLKSVSKKARNNDDQKQMPDDVAACETVIPCPRNLRIYLQNHEAWEGVIKWNAFAERIEFAKSPPWEDGVDEQNLPDDEEYATNVNRTGREFAEEDFVRIVDWFSGNERVQFALPTVKSMVPVVAKADQFHPVREYLEGLVWDKTFRLPTMLHVYAKTENTKYASEIGRRWMIQAVARVMNPGIQADCTLILEGKQGDGKTRFFRTIVPDPSFYSETGVNIGDKDSYLALHGKWIFLLDELDALKGDRAITKVKNFLTSIADYLRAPYAAGFRTYKRQNVFAATTNEDEYLQDKTGNRRFWPVKVHGMPDEKALERDRDQLWAEAVLRFRSCEKWHVDTPELRALFAEEVKKREPADPWEEPIAAFLHSHQHGDGVSLNDVMKALGFENKDMRDRESNRACRIMGQLGWRKTAERKPKALGQHYLWKPIWQEPATEPTSQGDMPF